MATKQWRRPCAPFASRLPDRLWGLSRRRYLALFGGTALLLLALIIGLAAGLATRRSSSRNLPLPGNSKQYTGELTYYEPGLGACGLTSTPNDRIVSVSHTLFDATTPGSDPNQNPLCGKKIRAQHTSTADGKTRSVDLTVVDRCVGCKETDLDITQPTFNSLAPDGDGRTTVTWAWLD